VSVMTHGIPRCLASIRVPSAVRTLGAQLVWKIWSCSASVFTGNFGFAFLSLLTQSMLALLLRFNVSLSILLKISELYLWFYVGLHTSSTLFPIKKLPWSSRFLVSTSLHNSISAHTHTHTHTHTLVKLYKSQVKTPLHTCRRWLQSY
jgi:hypothetical protein